jgi:hypothetical protein
MSEEERGGQKANGFQCWPHGTLGAQLG